MYKMNIEFFGQTFRVEVIIVSMIVGAILGTHLLCSCSKISVKEGLALLGAPTSYHMGEGVPTSWENKSELAYNGPNDWYKSLEGNTAPEPNKWVESGKLEFLAENKFDSKCCPSFYSGDMGCPCISPEQMKYLNSRGGNRTFPTEF
jgi:hypothetical protein